MITFSSSEFINTVLVTSVDTLDVTHKISLHTNTESTTTLSKYLLLSQIQFQQDLDQ